MHTTHRFLFASALFASLCLPVAASAASFTDVSASNPAYDAVEYLKSKGIVGGYADGTFKPKQQVNRAEALKLILTPVLPADGLRIYAHSPFKDVPDGAWFLPYVEAARSTLGVISGPPDKTNFLPSDPIKTSEFLKIFLLTQRVDSQGSYKELTGPLASDVNSSMWFFPYVRYALSASMIIVHEDGSLRPQETMTRADVAQLMYRYFMYKEGRRSQALLSVTESDLSNLMTMIDADKPDQATFAASRALVTSRGALSSEPNDSVVKGAVKTAEGFNFILQSYLAGKSGNLDAAIAKAGDAWNTANKAKELSPSLTDTANKMQALAKKLADSARNVKAEVSSSQAKN